jgi:hypothetical protein|tara:strand:+ start:127 stop:585 length:459 start_codon:yes stop_codon:yes gene_type:complete
MGFRIDLEFDSTTGSVVVRVLLCLVLICTLQPAIASADGFRNKGYFKDGRLNRIKSVELLKSQYSRSEVINWAKRTPNTPGQITQVYFYQRGGVIPSDGLTLDATSVWNAQDMLYEMRGLSKWRYAYVTMINGSTQFIDCEADPRNDFCRTK